MCKFAFSKKRNTKVIKSYKINLRATLLQKKLFFYSVFFKKRSIPVFLKSFCTHLIIQCHQKIQKRTFDAIFKISDFLMGNAFYFARINVSNMIGINFFIKICNSEIHTRLYICLILLVHLPPQRYMACQIQSIYTREEIF